MIKIKIVSKENQINKITITGHAGYDQYGKDIVCASVSSIVTTTVNAIIKFDKNNISFIDENELVINILNHNREVDILLENMIELFNELEKQYKKYIKVEK